MPLPADFPQPPKRPVNGQRLVTKDGAPDKSWLDYFDALDRFNRALRAHLETL